MECGCVRGIEPVRQGLLCEQCGQLLLRRERCQVKGEVLVGQAWLVGSPGVLDQPGSFVPISCICISEGVVAQEALEARQSSIQFSNLLFAERLIIFDAALEAFDQFVCEVHGGAAVGVVPAEDGHSVPPTVLCAWL